MSISSQFSRVSLPDVFKCLAAGVGVGTTVVTPNRRLGLALKNKFDYYQATQKNSVWESADILPFSAFIERIYRDALYSIPITELPVLLTPVQARALWESVIYGSDEGQLLLAVPQTAKFVHEAWQLVQAWQLFPRFKNFPRNEGGKAFQEWMRRYEQITKRHHQTDDARVCDLITELYEQLQIKKIKHLICYGFDTFTPQQISFLEKLVATGCTVMLSQPVSRDQPRNGSLQRVACVDSRDEIYRAAVWARARIEADSTESVGIVVPALADYRNAIHRIFGSVMTPNVESALPGSTPRITPFNVSLGIALTSYPMIDTLFQVLALVGREIEFERASLS
ncbi:MAG: hypothetical protein Q8L78_00335 [Coxiellaceae bacterium]|nr:hypothetical protein [Coxiellaceae bacterium]MDP1950517.1 hypothetical protein [Nitrosomonas sp.]